MGFAGKSFELRRGTYCLSEECPPDPPPPPVGLARTHGQGLSRHAIYRVKDGQGLARLSKVWSRGS